MAAKRELRLEKLRDEAQFVLDLVQMGDGRRHIIVREANEPQAEATVYSTVAASGSAVREAFRSGFDNLVLTSGGRFFVDAHNVWLTPEEFDYLVADDEPPTSPPWVNGVPPAFPPK